MGKLGGFNEKLGSKFSARILAITSQAHDNMCGTQKVTQQRCLLVGPYQFALWKCGFRKLISMKIQSVCI